MTAPLPVFCDWLKTADQAFSYQPKAWQSRILRATGRDIDWEKRAWIQLKHDSGDSAVRGRFLECGHLDSDGRQHGILHLDGNLGRFGAAHNLHGLHVRESAKRVLDLLGSATDTFYSNPLALHLRRVDLTCNFAFSTAADASAYIAWAAQHHLGRAPSRSYATGCSWVTENWSAKVYDKIADLRRHKLNDLADELIRQEGYVLRLETTLRTDELMRLQATRLDQWSTDMENVIFTERFSPILRGENLPSLDEVAEKLPIRLSNAIQAWRNGTDFLAAARDGRINIRTYRRLRADLKPYGIDIATRCNVSTFAIRPRLIDMRPLAQLTWLEKRAA